ncbi:MAG: adenine phosphoribosyltransferase [Mariniphaga sp.]|jgi:adenine phosphoribosyltransferase|nr:adenine phosphoribosyltransferase [Mariniphaga sp.]
MDLKSKIREIPDFPVAGVSFKDITTLLKEHEALEFVVDEILSEFKNKNITKVIGIESRGFIFGGALANGLKAGFVPARKKGKLPADKISETYKLEYGYDTIEMHSDALAEDDVVLIHDDLLATGGTANAVYNMVKSMGIRTVYFSFLCNLEFIHTPEKLIIQNMNPHVLVKY